MFLSDLSALIDAAIASSACVIPDAERIVGACAAERAVSNIDRPGCTQPAAM